MTPDAAAHIVEQMFFAAVRICGPLLAIGLAAGILVSLVQIVTSIQDSVFSAVPRLAAFLGACLFLLPWMIRQSMNYAEDILGNLSRYVH